MTALPEDEKVLYATDIEFAGFDGEGLELLVWMAPAELEAMIEATPDEDFLRFEDIYGRVYYKRKETIKEFSIGRAEMVNTKKKVRDKKAKNGTKGKVLTPEQQAKKILAETLDKGSD